MKDELKVVYRHMPERSDGCIYCGAERSVEMYNDYNRPVNYSALLDKNVDKFTMLSLKIKYAKCNKCGIQSNIYWDHTQQFPVPLYTKSLVDLFMQINFKQQ